VKSKFQAMFGKIESLFNAEMVYCKTLRQVGTHPAPLKAMYPKMLGLTEHRVNRQIWSDSINNQINDGCQISRTCCEPP